jgi:transcriptional regulator with XRE-family HTH domain
MKVIRLERNLYQQDVVEYMRKFDLSFDTPMLSKFENGFCLPTPYQLMKLAELYECKPSDLIVIDNSVLDIYA